MGALRLTGETSWKKAQQVQGCWDRTRWAEVPSCIHSLWVAGAGGGLVAKSCPTLATPWTVAQQAPLSMRFSRQEYRSGLPFPFPGDLPDPGVKPGSPALQAVSFPTELQWVAGGLHKWSRAPTEGCGQTKGTGAPWRSRREWQVPSSTFCVLAHCSLALGQRHQCVQTDRDEKGPPQSQPSWIPSGRGD